MAYDTLDPICMILFIADNLSIQFPRGAKPLIIFGHDECIFKQFTMSRKQWCWYGPNKETYIVPKDDGMGIMIVSAFQYREFGFGLQITEQDFKIVSESRVGTKYMDEQAAQDMRRSALNPGLTSAPFVREFEQYRANSEGHWYYQHVVLQLEDFVDVLKVFFPRFDFLLLFDHS